MIIAFVHPLALPPRARPALPRRRCGGISPWVVLWGLNELSRGSRGGWGGGVVLGRRRLGRRRRRRRRLLRRRRLVRRRRSGRKLVMSTLRGRSRQSLGRDRRGGSEQQRRDRRGRDADQRSLPRRRAALGAGAAVRGPCLGRLAADGAHLVVRCPVRRLAARSDPEPAADLADGVRGAEVHRRAADPQMDAASAVPDAARRRSTAACAAERSRSSRLRRSGAPTGGPGFSSTCRWPSAAPRSSPTRRSLKVTTTAYLGRGDDRAADRSEAGRLGDGIVAAVERVGAVLSQHFPRSAADINEIPDQLIEL